MAAGDFNAIAFSDDKIGGRPPTASQLNELNNVMDECGMQELEGFGANYTWTNNQADEDNIQERLDHVLINQQ
ncbi:hypothetical protein FRX31_034716 [Thalictrum thalictroides]|uniref:Endonuclease/exonuclease/phosphatase domain-containing protein n=1 Tax=Thalictrum thalictroides TaxID=46969 RepID=A0A7J6UT26_THATH|nr:hypothetical protein FRX31_034716 [Thalictrum thalictroides]